MKTLKQEEAFVVGFCMGNDPDTQKIHLQIYKFFSRYIYPKHYKFNKKHLIKFDWGFYYGRSLYRYVGFLKKKTINKKAINKLKLFSLEHYTVEGVRDYLGILTSDLDYLEKKYQQQIQAPTKGGRHTHLKKQFGKGLKISSSFCAVVGGFILASKLSISGYGFIILACSSSQMLVASLIEKDLTLVCYSGAVFLFVDLYGVYKWLLT